MQDFRNLVVWQKSHAITLEMFSISAQFSRPPFYLLQNQVIRAAISISANLAEGAGRNGDREFRRFVRIAMGSASELEYHLLLARDLRLISGSTHARLSAAVQEVKRMLTGLAGSLGRIEKASATASLEKT